MKIATTVLACFLWLLLVIGAGLVYCRYTLVTEVWLGGTMIMFVVAVAITAYSGVYGVMKSDRGACVTFQILLVSLVYPLAAVAVAPHLRADLSEWVIEFRFWVPAAVFVAGFVFGQGRQFEAQKNLRTAQSATAP